MLKGDLVTIIVDQEYSSTKITFEVIKELPDNCFVLMAQDRIVIGHQSVNKTWQLSKSFDLFDLTIVKGKHHVQSSMSSGNNSGTFITPEYERKVKLIST